MLTSTGPRLFLVILTVVTLFGNASGLRCYHCVYKVETISNGSASQVLVLPESDTSPYISHQSCSYGEEPDNNLSVNCDALELAPEMNIGSYAEYSDPSRYAELEHIIDANMNKTPPHRYACMAVKITEARNGQDGVKLELHSTFRTCIPDSLNFADVLEDIKSWGSENVTGYKCDLFNNCNGKGDAQSHLSAQSLPENSGGSKIVELGWINFAVFISAILQILYSLNFKTIA
ncbi:unnamed protein product [Orchesella dallaii]|uniref:Uncharacterized protein n=1 Tax=Orchesella dallaii TaxID=48710 RepID=A0ABP1QCF4_9HEXA